MSQAALPASRVASTKGLAADSLSKSIVLFGCLLIAQRGIGFLRSFYVCGRLSPTELGQWDLAFNFLMIVAPLAVLGIPGSFGRYVARFEKNGQQRRLLRHTLLACLGLTGLASLASWLLREPIAQYCFGSAQHVDLVVILAAGLPVIVFFNFATSWFTGKRLNRVVFRIQFVQTLFFALLCVVALQMAAATALAVVVAYLVSCLIGTLLAASYVLIASPTEVDGPEDYPSAEDHTIWRKILPFAIWVWVSNALFNFFSVCDRLLLVNFNRSSEVDAQFLVGQYHTACVFPLLLMSIGATAGSMLIPYLSKDWESGGGQLVHQRINMMLKAMAMFCLCASLAILFVAPKIFGELWQNKFAIGESLLPATLCYCSLAAMTFIAQKYFWCIEKTWLSGCILLIGLVSNFLIGLLLIGPYGIQGVVASTLVAHAIVLLGVLVQCHRHGLKLDAGVVVMASAVMAISFGKWIAVLCFFVLVGLVVFTNVLFLDSHKQLAIARLRRLRSSLLGTFT